MAVLDTFRLDGKVALVTGGSRGLGLQIAEALGEAGAAVAITARREEGLLKAVEHLTQHGIKAMSAVCDISKNDQVEAAVRQVLEQFEHIDVLVNNAGATWGAPFEELPFEAWDKVIRTNLKRGRSARSSAHCRSIPQAFDDPVRHTVLYGMDSSATASATSQKMEVVEARSLRESTSSHLVVVWGISSTTIGRQSSPEYGQQASVEFGAGRLLAAPALVKEF
jgi:NAD(P)-dependent dehydrogenase (short-subunit alcohol dehydrogenase family)